MNGEGNKDDDLLKSEDGIDEEEILEDPDSTIVLTEVDAGDDLGETVADLNVDALVEKIESADAETVAKKRAAKKRATKKRATKKRATKKRATKKRATKKIGRASCRERVLDGV